VPATSAESTDTKLVCTTVLTMTVSSVHTVDGAAADSVATSVRPLYSLPVAPLAAAANTTACDVAAATTPAVAAETDT
jgi:hypothetical protein